MKTNTSSKQKMSVKARIAIGVTVVVILGLIATIVYLVLPKDSDKKDNRPTVVTEQNVEEVIEAMDKPVTDGYYEVSMNTKWTFDGGSSNAFVENATSNTRTVYFDVTLADTGELVYSSPYIPVGSKIENFALDAKLNPGAYNGIVTYHLVDDNHEEVSNLAVTVSFQVN